MSMKSICNSNLSGPPVGHTGWSGVLMDEIRQKMVDRELARLKGEYALLKYDQKGGDEDYFDQISKPPNMEEMRDANLNKPPNALPDSNQQLSGVSQVLRMKRY